MAACSDVSQKDKKDEPLLIFYDSEAANGNVHYGDLIEIAATCHPGVVVGSFESFVDTKQQLCSFALYQSGITKHDLSGKPSIDKVIEKFLEWIREMVALANEKNKASYFPVICAHGGYHFDFLILFSNLERKGFPYKKFSDNNIHFADSFLFCKKLQDDGNPLLQNTKLSIDGLFNTFFPKHTIKGRHRAMGDVKAMIKIFTQTSLKSELHSMNFTTTQERIEYFISQSSRKLQQRILEEKMASLDACSRNMCSKTLIKEGMTYDVLKTVFQQCSSYMDFWQTLKNVGIERKVAKHFTSQFGALGLQNEGALGYCLDIAKQNGAAVSNGMDSQENEPKHSSGNSHTAVTNSLKPSKTYSSQNNEFSKPPPSIKDVQNPNAPCSGNSLVSARSVSSSQAFEQRPMDYALTSSSEEVRPRICDANGVGREQNSKKESEIISSETKHPTNPPESGNSEESSREDESENWDSEISNSAGNNETFVLKINDVIPVSVGIDDFSSDKSHPKRPKRNSNKDSDRSDRPAARNIKTDGVKIKNSSEFNRKRNSNVEGTKSSSQESKVLKSTSISEVRSIKENSKTTISDVNTRENLDGLQTNEEGNIREPKSKTIQNVLEETGHKDTSDYSQLQGINHPDDHNSQGSFIKQRPGNINRSVTKNNKKRTQSKDKRNKQISNQTKSVIFLDLPGSPDFKGKDATIFFVGDIEICVPVEKRDVGGDVPLQEGSSVDMRDNEHNGSSEPTDVSPSPRVSLRDDEGDNIPMSQEVSPLSHDKGMSLRDVERDGLDNPSDTIKVEVSKNEDILNSFDDIKVKTNDAFANGEVIAKEEEMAETSEKAQIKELNDSSCALVKGQDEDKCPAKTQDSQNEEMSRTLDASGSCNEDQTIEYTVQDIHNDALDPVESITNTVFDEQQPEQQTLQAYDEILDGNYPPMYQMQPVPLRFTPPCPTGMPTAVPAGYGFYPPMGPMMPMFSGPPFVPFPGVPYPAHQGFVPFSGFQHRYPLPGHVFQQPTIYHQHELETSSVHLGSHNLVPPSDIHRESPDTLGIPFPDIDRIVPEKTSRKAHVSDSYSTTSDETSESSTYLENEGFENASSNVTVSDSSREDLRSDRRRVKERNYSKRSLKEKHSPFREVLHKGKEVRANKEREDQSGSYGTRKAKEKAGQSRSSFSMSPRASKTKSSKDLSFENESKGNPSKPNNFSKPRSSPKSGHESTSSEKPSSLKETNKRKSPSRDTSKDHKESKKSEVSAKKSDGSPKNMPLKSSLRESDKNEVPSKDQEERGLTSKMSTNIANSNSKPSTPRSESKSSSAEGSPKSEEELTGSSIKQNESTFPKSTQASCKKASEDEAKLRKENNITNETRKSPISNHPQPSKPSPLRPSKREFTKEKRSQNANDDFQLREYNHHSSKKSTERTPPRQPTPNVSKFDVSPKSDDSGRENKYPYSSKKAEGPSQKSTPSNESSTAEAQRFSDHGSEVKHSYQSKKFDNVHPKSTPPRQSNKSTSSKSSPKSSGSGSDAEPKSKVYDSTLSQINKTSSRRDENESLKPNISSSKSPILKTSSSSMESKRFENIDTKQPRQEVNSETSSKGKQTENGVKTTNPAADKPKSIQETKAEGKTTSLTPQNNEAARKLKWPLSVWSGGTIKAPPKPQRDPLAKRRIRESQTKYFVSGPVSDKKFTKTPSAISESHRDNSGNSRGVLESGKNHSSDIHRNVPEGNRSPYKKTDYVAKGTSVSEGHGNSTLKENNTEHRNNSIIAENKGSSKLDISEKEIEKSSSKTANYRDILVGKTNPESTRNTNSSTTEGSSTNGFRKGAKDYKKSNKSVENPNNNNIAARKFTGNSPVNTSRSDIEWKDGKANSERQINQDTKISKSHKYQSHR